VVQTPSGLIFDRVGVAERAVHSPAHRLNAAPCSRRSNGGGCAQDQRDGIND
jgi:hypothetical protein